MLAAARPCRIAAAALLLAASAATAAAGRTTHTVVIDSLRFEPETITVKAGETVVWVNRDPFPHTATAPSGAFDSKNIAAGKSWRYRPRKPGIYPYVCTLHPTMKGTLQVE